MKTAYLSFLSFAPRRPPTRGHGFSLLEVLVALLVISFGLLGIAGMQALSISNTNVAAFRGIAAAQANSMAVAMQSNEQYWTIKGGLGAPLATIESVICTLPCASWTSTALTGPLAATATDCTANYCAPAIMAAYDLQTWGQTLAQVLPGGNATVICNTPNAPPAPTACQIFVYWTEKNLVQNQASSITLSTAGSTNHFELVVTP